MAETLRQEAETLADTAEDEKDSITKQEYEEYRNNVRILRAGQRIWRMRPRAGQPRGPQP